MLYGWFLEPAWLKIRQEKVRVAAYKLKQPINILFLSDFHGGRFSQPKVLKHKLKVLRSAIINNPVDLVLLGGDYVDGKPEELMQIQPVFDELNLLKVPVLGVIGNHDYRRIEDIDIIATALQEKGVEILRNQGCLKKIGGSEVYIAGLADLKTASGYYNEKKYATRKHYQEVAASLDWYRSLGVEYPEAVKILLSHNPDGVHLVGRMPPEVVLAGHTHGGQYFFLDWLSRYFERWIYRCLPMGSFGTWAGRRIVGQTTLIVSRGFGSAAIPLRLGRRPEALFLKLEPYRVPKNLIIGISGKLRSGKDVLARMVQVYFPGIRRIGFSYSLKEEFDRIQGTNTRFNEGDKEKYREGLHKLGAKRRAEDPDYWVKRALAVEPPLVIKDVRLPQEAEAIKRLGGILIRLEVPNRILKQRLKKYAKHITLPEEILLDNYNNWDFLINNKGSIRQLEKSARQVCAQIEAMYNETKPE